MLEMENLFKLGYSECVEIYNILTQFKPNNYRIVTGDLLKRFGKMKELGIDTTGLPQPITPQDEVDEEEDVEVGPVLKKKKFTMLDMDRIVDAAHVLTKMKVGYDEIMDSLNLEMPQGVINPQIGMCVEEPKHGLIIQTHKGVLGLQRSAELHRVSNIHLYALRQVLDSNVSAFWTKSSIDTNESCVRLKSNSYTTTIILDLVAAASIQIMEVNDKMAKILEDDRRVDFY
ncbi:hypothetical protein Tco_0144168 [Tanacetum coccineum]